MFSGLKEKKKGEYQRIEMSLIFTAISRIIKSLFLAPDHKTWTQSFKVKI